MKDSYPEEKERRHQKKLHVRLLSHVVVTSAGQDYARNSKRLRRSGGGDGEGGATSFFFEAEDGPGRRRAQDFTALGLPDACKGRVLRRKSAVSETELSGKREMCGSRENGAGKGTEKRQVHGRHFKAEKRDEGLNRGGGSRPGGGRKRERISLRVYLCKTMMTQGARRDTQITELQTQT